MTVEKCEFRKNFGTTSLFDLGQTNLNFYDSNIINNTNNLFSLVSSTFLLVNTTIMNQICLTTIVGCIISAIENSEIEVNFSKFENISSEIQEGNIFLENSILQMQASIMNSLKTKKKQGSCFSLYNSGLNLFDSNFFNYQFNCLYLIQSQAKILSAIFNNRKYSEMLREEYSNFGTIYCLQCQYLFISNGFFIENTKILDGSSLYALAKKDDILGNVTIENSYFFGNGATGKGTICIFNQNLSIYNTHFENNSAEKGGAIFLNNDGKINNFLKIYTVFF